MISEFIKQNPKLAIIIISLLVSIFVSLIYKLTIDQVRMKELKDKQKKLQEEIKKHKENPEKMLELQKEMMGHSGEMMKHSFKPMLLTFIPFLILFNWLRSVFISTSLEKSWIWWYIILTLVFNLLLKKVFKIEY